ncbi:MAG TPA: methylmalonyl Co-A mutase-associated GTPase MeaB [Nitrospiraceae bacterium]|nr:methylmalonyl Co-A mutase-associated GTPase MeaB [Nitrospiraceae bacterium]
MNNVVVGEALMKKDRERADALAGHVKAGHIRAISRTITLLESGDPMGRAVLGCIENGDRRSIVIGITGYPGAGKSTLIDQLITAYRQQGKTVGVLAVDMTSPLTGGALLGDRIRMQEHILDKGVYIRSMATRGQQGGVAAATRETVLVLEAAGFDIILVETVGVGQSEMGIVDVAQTVLVVVAPGLGDDIQAMKAGVLEIAHIVVVNKGDHAGAEATIRDLREWYPCVLRTVAVKGEGISELMAAIAERQLIDSLPRHNATQQDQL